MSTLLTDAKSVSRNVNLLCHLHRLPATEHCPGPKDWPAHTSRLNNSLVGILHDWHGLRAELDGPDGASCGSRYTGGRFLPEYAESIYPPEAGYKNEP